MVEFFVNNFNWPTFWLSFGFFILTANIVSFIVKLVMHKRAKKRVRQAEAKHQELVAQFKAKEAELNQLLGKKESK